MTLHSRTYKIFGSMAAFISSLITTKHPPRLRRAIQLIFLTVLPLLVLSLASCITLGKALEQAPDFEVTLFDGSSFRLSDQIGQRSVVLNFWFPSCPPCRAEMPEFQRFYDEYNDRVTLIGIDIGPFMRLGTHRDAENLLRELGIT